jgi:hypothetical protein
MDINFFSSSAAAQNRIIKRDIKSLIKKFLGSSDAVIIVLENRTGNLLGLITVPRGMNLSGSLISFVHRAPLQKSQIEFCTNTVSS